MSGMPYAIGLFNCLIYTLYGSRLISNGWDNGLVMGTNAFGFLFQFCFCAIYLHFAAPKSKRRMGLMVGGVLMVFASTVASSMWVVEGGHKKVLVGTTGMVASVILYGSPLSDIVPDFFGIPLALLQMIIFCTYQQKSRIGVADLKLNELTEQKDTMVIEKGALSPSLISNLSLSRQFSQ